jgi:hypothetical protein
LRLLLHREDAGLRRLIEQTPDIDVVGPAPMSSRAT